MTTDADPRAARIIAAVQARGSDAADLRDAAHEAHHAIEFKARRWDRTSIHRAVEAGSKRRAHVLASPSIIAMTDEVTARAVEQMVCSELGVDCGSVTSWATITLLEAQKQGIPVPGVEWIVERVHVAMGRESTRRAVARIIALSEIPARKTRAARAAAVPA